MGRYLLCGKEAELPFEIEELDLRIYTIEELCYYIYNNLMLIGDDFIGDRLIDFIRNGLSMPEIADKIERFHTTASDLDATLVMLLSEVGYYTEPEIAQFSRALMKRRKTNGPERIRMKADGLAERKRYYAAIRYYRTLLREPRDGRMSSEFYLGVRESMADCYGRLCRFDRAFQTLAPIYEQTKSDRILKKMYDISVLSGSELPPVYFSKVPDTRLSEWQQDYWNRESRLKDRIRNAEVMQIFLKDPEKIKEALAGYTAAIKEEYRSMLE
ncbi:MAG: hypothetical protein IJM76_09015 [Lachnospiraceae bacterium]|nr:hypothetical protein [Lachnospiraceae bacterium]